MLNNYYKYETNMCNDSSGTFGDCPKAKKSKHSESENIKTSLIKWAHLPSVVLLEIFDYLSKEDRKNASSICKHWRQALYHRKWWPDVTFRIEPGTKDMSKYFTSAFGKLVTHATIRLNSLSIECMEDFITLLQILSENTNLKSLILEPTHCRFELPTLRMKESEENGGLILRLIKACLPYLSRFSIGCIEDLSHEIEELLQVMTENAHPAKVTLLGLASVKDDPLKYKSTYFTPRYILPFKNLEILSIDYEQLSDQFLSYLKEANSLKRLVVHLHEVRNHHPGTTEMAWKDFKVDHPECELRLTIIHAFADIFELDTLVLRKEMPLSHLKVFFCESVNITVLELMSVYYNETLKSLLWVDSLSQNDSSWMFASSFFDDRPDPFIIISWLCKYLEEIVFLGYKYREENLVAIARLRGPKLKKLDIAEDDILFCNQENCLEDIPMSIKKFWSPLKRSELHPVLCNPTFGDSDEYLLPFVLADLQ